MPGSGLLYDLGPHLLDQAISLFGRPLFSRKTTATFRPGSQVNDYFCLHLHYPDGLQVHLTSSLLVARPQAAFVLHGTQGSFSKVRADVQERSFSKELPPRRPPTASKRPTRRVRLPWPPPMGR